MPHAAVKSVINATYEHVLALLIDKAERPKKFVKVILYSDIVERGDGYLIREMFQPKPVPNVIKEKIYERDIPGGKEFIYELMNNKDYTGRVHNILRRVDGRLDLAELEYVLDWKPRDGAADKMSPETAHANMKISLNSLKDMAENPVVVPDFVQAWFDAVDAKDMDAMARLLSKDCRFRMGNHLEINGRDNVINANREGMKMFASLNHDYLDVVSVGNRTYVETYVEYVMPDNRKYLLPFMTVLERRDGAISDIKVFGDGSPLKHGW